MNMFKRLIDLRQIGLIDKIIKLTSQERQLKKMLKEYRSVQNAHRSTWIQKVKYGYQIIISEMFCYAIATGKIDIAFHMFTNNPDKIYSSKNACVDAIISILQINMVKDCHFIRFEEVLTILKSFIKYIDFRSALEILSQIDEMLSASPEDSFLVY
mmetsp:Transcript_5226/g.6188  ORF Transcript_5226/g.6188 Transcript_5226/m.6188 type:complete len:156 (+) Transcript_5226:667-1134(+)